MICSVPVCRESLCTYFLATWQYLWARWPFSFGLPRVLRNRILGMEQELQPNKIYSKVPYEVRQAALQAIKKGVGLEAVAEANAFADEINKTSFYKNREETLPIFELV